MENKPQGQTSSQSPFANFYELVFSVASPGQQEAFLRQLFTIDGSLCASFAAFINPPLDSIEIDTTTLVTAVAQMREKIRKYDWEVLWDMNPLADEYSAELWHLLEKDITGKYELQMRASASIGDLLSSLNCLRIMELGTNLDWQEVKEPASYYPNEVKIHINSQFDAFISCFLGNIFSEAVIRKAIETAKAYQASPGLYFSYAQGWNNIVRVMEARLGSKA